MAEVCAEVVKASILREGVGCEAVACGVVAVLKSGSFAHDGGLALPVFGHQGACACVFRHGGKEGRECRANAHEAHLTRFCDGWADVDVFCAVRFSAYVFPGELGEFFGADAGEEEDCKGEAGVGAVEPIDGGDGGAVPHGVCWGVCGVVRAGSEQAACFRGREDVHPVGGGHLAALDELKRVPVD